VKLPKHIPQLDVLRGVAVLVVMLYHITDIVPRLHLKPVFGLGYGLRKILFPHSSIAAEVTLFLISLALCYGLAAASWRFFESRLLKLKSRFEYAFPPAAGTSVRPGVSGGPIADRVAD
jgi:peptidoglycan/LPS O-acetylase OafA/YrhL